jgi:ABC-2 type transport system ATP-binding protein
MPNWQSRSELTTQHPTVWPGFMFNGRLAIINHVNEERPTMIRLDSLTKRYGDLVAVDDLSLQISEGEIFAFLGPNGAGKTTTIKMMTTLLAPTSGRISLNGLDPQKRQAKARKSFGIVFQDPSLDEELTAFENMEYHGVLYGMPRTERQKRVREMLSFMGLWDRRSGLVRTFSGGMRRRLEIARGLMHRPRILFLDEPTLGLDPQTRRHIWSYVLDLNRQVGVTVFLTTHLMEEAERVAERIGIIDQGRLVAEGTVEEIKGRSQAKTLEDAFIALTGQELRDSEASSLDRFRQHRRHWNRR